MRKHDEGVESVQTRNGNRIEHLDVTNCSRANGERACRKRYPETAGRITDNAPPSGVDLDCCASDWITSGVQNLPTDATSTWGELPGHARLRGANNACGGTR